MIHVSKRALAQVEYLLAQSAQGNHVLFNPDEVRGVFERASRSGASISEEEAYESEPHLERLLEEPTIDGKRAYLLTLQPPVFERVVLTYFTILENNLFESTEVRH